MLGSRREEKFVEIPSPDTAPEPIDIEAVMEAEDQGTVYGVYQHRAHVPKEFGNFSPLYHPQVARLIENTNPYVVTLFLALTTKQRWMGFVEPHRVELARMLKVSPARISQMMQELLAVEEPRVLVELNGLLADEIHQEWKDPETQGVIREAQGNRLLLAGKQGGIQPAHGRKLYLLRPDLCSLGRARDIHVACQLWDTLTGEPIVATWGHPKSERAADQERNRAAREAQHQAREEGRQRRKAEADAIRARDRDKANTDKWARMLPSTRQRWLDRAAEGDPQAVHFISLFTSLAATSEGEMSPDTVRLRLAAAESTLGLTVALLRQEGLSEDAIATGTVDLRAECDAQRDLLTTVEEEAEGTTGRVLQLFPGAVVQRAASH